MNNCTISNSKIGIASKDNSYIDAKNCEIKNCVYGLVAFQKKPEYGAAKIITSNLKWNNIINIYLIEEKSFIKLNGRNKQGTEKNVAKLFY